MARPERRANSRFGVTLALIGLAAFAVRVAYVLVVADDIPTVGDAQTYHLLASNLADGRGYIRPHDYIRGEVIPSAEFPPLFPAFLAVLNLGGLESVAEQKLVMAVCGSGTVVAVGLLGRRVAGAPVGIVSAAIAAVYPMLFQIDGALMPETLYVLLVTAALIAASRALGADGVRWWAVTGVALGLATLVRAEAALLGPLLVSGLLWQRVGWRRTVAATGAIAAAAASVVLPWTIRNVIRLDHFVPVSNNFGGLVLGANCPPTYAGEYVGLWLFECYDRVDAAGLDETERAQAYLREGLGYAESHADRAAVVAGIRLLRIWGAWDPQNQVEWEAFEGRSLRWQTVGHRMYVALALASLAGIALLARRRAQLWPLLATVVLVSFTAVVSYGNQRFRAAAEPALVVLAAVALVEAGQAAANRFRRPA